LTDLTQPMHASNFTYLSSRLPGYHTDFESFVMETQSTVTPPTQYTSNLLVDDPGEFFISAAQNSKSKYYNSIYPDSIVDYYIPKLGLLSSQRKLLRPFIQPILTDAINIASQYLVAWWTMGQNDITRCQFISGNSGLALEISGGSNKTGTPAQQNTWNNTSAQQFTLVPLTGDNQGYYKILTACSNSTLVLDAHGPIPSQFQVVQCAWNGGTTQQWQLVHTHGSGVALQSQVNSAQPGNQLFLTATAPLSQPRYPISLGQSESSGAQEWLLTPVAPVFIALCNSQPPLFADIKGSSTNPGAPLQVYRPNQSNAQIFLWVPLSGSDADYYMIINKSGGLVLESAISLSSFHYVVQDCWTSSDSQKWMRVPQGPNSGNFYIQNKASGLYMLVDTPSTQGSQVICGWPASTLWMLTSLDLPDIMEDSIEETLAAGT
jgi:hypothetical protein